MRQMVENKQRERLAHNSDQLQLFQPNYVGFTWSDMHGGFRGYFFLVMYCSGHSPFDGRIPFGYRIYVAFSYTPQFDFKTNI